MLVETTIGKVGFRRTAHLSELLLTKNLAGTLEYINEVLREGHNIVDLTKETIHYLRRALSLKLDPRLFALFAEELTGKELETLTAHSALTDVARTPRLIKSLIRAYSEIRYSPFASVPLEVAIIEELRNK